MATASLLVGGFALPMRRRPSRTTPPVVRLADPRITESSGLVDLGADWVTTNDSGDSARLFVVSPRTGRTVGLVTDCAPSVVDVEALAPAGPSAVWVGDIGDNNAERKSVSVFRVPVGHRPHRRDAPALPPRLPDRAGPTPSRSSSTARAG